MTLTLGPVIGQIGGGGVEEIPVSMSGGGNQDVVYPLATVDARDGAWVIVTGDMSPGATGGATRPHLRVGTVTHTDPAGALGGDAVGLASYTSGQVQLSVISRASASTSFSGTVYVIRL